MGTKITELQPETCRKQKAPCLNRGYAIDMTLFFQLNSQFHLLWAGEEVPLRWPWFFQWPLHTNFNLIVKQFSCFDHLLLHSGYLVIFTDTCILVLSAYIRTCLLAHFCHQTPPLLQWAAPWGLVHTPVTMETPLSLVLQSWILDTAVRDS